LYTVCSIFDWQIGIGKQGVSLGEPL